MGNERMIRRPVNLLIPLEIGDSHQSDTNPTRSSTNNNENADKFQGRTEDRYNLRPRVRKDSNSAFVNFTRRMPTTILLLMAWHPCQTW